MVTTTCIIGANGTELPPIMVFPRVHYQVHMLVGAYPRTLGLAAPSGWMRREIVPGLKSPLRHALHMQITVWRVAHVMRQSLTWATTNAGWNPFRKPSATDGRVGEPATLHWEDNDLSRCEDGAARVRNTGFTGRVHALCLPSMSS